MNRNAERGRATREQLLDVAEALFAANGYEDTSTEAVLREAGVSRGSLYHHFPSKDALFYAVLEQVEERIFVEMMETHAGRLRSGRATTAGRSAGSGWPPILSCGASC